jgi:FkbM family methyltransferase
MDYDEYIKEPLPFASDLRPYFSKKDSLVIFEIGSCEGEDTIRLKRNYPNSTIYTFEALPKNVHIIKTNLKRYGLPTDKVFSIALSDKKGSADFYVSSGHPDDLPKAKNWDYGNKSSSLLPPKEHKNVLKWVKFKEKVKVPTERLDSFCKAHGISKIDFIYLDVQGAELMVLQGAGDLIKNIGAIWMEVEAIELYKGQPLKNDVEKFMKKSGFVRAKDTVDEISGDQLYLRQNLPYRKTLHINFKQLIRRS